MSRDYFLAAIALVLFGAGLLCGFLARGPVADPAVAAIADTSRVELHVIVGDVDFPVIVRENVIRTQLTIDIYDYPDSSGNWRPRPTLEVY
jgi:hypothetical protein